MAVRKYTDEQLQDAYREHGSYAKAAKSLGLNLRTVERRFADMRRRGWSPEHDMTRIVPDGFHLKGASTLYGPNGEQKLQWVKSQIDHERQAELMREALIAMGEEIPRAHPEEPPSHTLESLLNCYVVTDYHMGMMSWHEETGDDWDLKSAQDLLIRWFGRAIQSSPDAEIGVLANIGDFLHWDGLDAVTPASKHLLDADTRFQKLVRIAIRCIRFIISMMLRKHQQVHVLMCDANHDPASESWIREWLPVLYENEPRVTIDKSASTYYCYEHGQTSLFFHHGHRKKPASVDDVFVAKFRDVFGRTKYSYAHMGHLHHVAALETNLMIVEQHHTLAAKDAYAAQHGYMSGRDAKVITYHRDYGEVSRLTISPEMLV